jgi:hypothetical protein
MPELDSDDIPIHAAHITIGMCKEPACGKLHIILFDKNGKPLAAGSIDNTEEFIKEVQSWAYIAATRRPL